MTDSKVQREQVQAQDELKQIISHIIDDVVDRPERVENAKEMLWRHIHPHLRAEADSRDPPTREPEEHASSRAT